MGKEKLSITGGGRVGWVNATWPLAKLTVQKNKIDLNATLIGKYSFTQEQIISINNNQLQGLTKACLRVMLKDVKTHPAPLLFPGMVRPFFALGITQ